MVKATIIYLLHVLYEASLSKVSLEEESCQSGGRLKAQIEGYTTRETMSY